MSSGVVDTTVVLHLYRKDAAAQAWYTSLTTRPSVTPMTWLEVMEGVRGTAGQAASFAILSQFPMLYQTIEDMDWAMKQMHQMRLSHGVAIMDCLIAAPCHRLQIPLYTHNVRHMTVLLGAALVVKPY